MALAENLHASVEEYLKMREESDALLEYIDGLIYMSPSPSIKHQRISGRLYALFFNYLIGKSCEVFHAPTDIELKKKDKKGTKIVIPDLSVICDKSGFTDTRYVGVPSLIVEILSPSNQSHDLVTKLNLYMEYGVKEYWIINPILECISVYTLDDKGMYNQLDMKTSSGIIKSKVLEDFTVDLQEIF